MMKKFAWLIVAVALSVGVASGKDGLKIEHWQSGAGVKVLFVESSALPILDVRLDFAAGSIFESADKAGLAALTNVMLNLGAGDLSEAEISNRLADVGALLSTHVTGDSAGLSLRVLSTPEKQEAALEVFTHILASPRFEADIFEREQARVIARLKDSLTRPGTLATRALTAALYPDHPYGFLPTPENLADISVEDARQFWRRHYIAEGTVLSIVGDLDRAGAEALAERLSEALPTGKAPTLPEPPHVMQPIRQSARQEIRIPHPASQAHIYLGTVAIARDDPDFFPVVVGNYILGGGFVSRLMGEVREKSGYAYSVYSNFSPQKQAGPFEIVLETRKEQADDALELTLNILSDFLDKGPTAAEVAAAKAYLSGSFPLRLDSNRKILGQVAAIGVYDLPLDYLAEYRKHVEAVRIADIRAAFSRHVDMERLVTVVVGAAAAQEPEAGEEHAISEP
ncbi:MAG: insulinase family protein [Betaproteobacteria bacterium]|nr:insulinase family protein [Betaproteobacteria bacterium]